MNLISVHINPIYPRLHQFYKTSSSYKKYTRNQALQLNFDSPGDNLDKYMYNTRNFQSLCSAVTIQRPAL